MASNVTTKINGIAADKPSFIKHFFCCFWSFIIFSKFEKLLSSIFSKHRFESYEANIKCLWSDISFFLRRQGPLFIKFFFLYIYVFTFDLFKLLNDFYNSFTSFVILGRRSFFSTFTTFRLCSLLLLLKCIYLSLFITFKSVHFCQHINFLPIGCDKVTIYDFPLFFFFILLNKIRIIASSEHDSFFDVFLHKVPNLSLKHKFFSSKLKIERKIGKFKCKISHFNISFIEDFWVFFISRLKQINETYHEENSEKINT